MPMTMRSNTPEETMTEGEATAVLSNKVHDLIQCLSEKLDAVWRYDEYMEDCEDDTECAEVFARMKEDDTRHAQMLRDQIERLCRNGEFH
jgi:hypothetical protein